MAAKPVPARRRFTPTESLEAAAALGWPAREQARLGDWLLRATDGWTQRANSALTIGSPDLPLPEAIEFVSQWYRERGLVPAMSIPVPLFHRLDTELERRGWVANPVTQVMTTPITTLLPPPSASSEASATSEVTTFSEAAAFSDAAATGGAATSDATTPEGTTFSQAAATADAATSADVLGGSIRLATSPSEEWLTQVAGRKGPLPTSARDVLTGVPNVRFAEWRDANGTLLATARGCVADPDSRWLGLSLIGVDERLRRRGLARTLITALAEWAATLGARDVYLQVEQRNTPAVTLYSRLGFTVHHVYSSRRLLTQDAAT